jgi:4-hydroxythreonine-4-phosphate dehydrogenase
MISELPIVGITLGDVAGIGPEVVVKALHHSEIHKWCRPLVIGDSRVFSDPKFAASAEQVHSITSLKAAAFEPGEITVLDLHNLDPAIVTVGEVSAVAGRAAVEYVLKAADLARSGQIDAIATAPLNKEAMRLAGYDYIGHTEILMDVTHTEHCTPHPISRDRRQDHPGQRAGDHHGDGRGDATPGLCQAAGGGRRSQSTQWRERLAGTRRAR